MVELQFHYEVPLQGLFHLLHPYLHILIIPPFSAPPLHRLFLIIGPVGAGVCCSWQRVGIKTPDPEGHESIMGRAPLPFPHTPEQVESA